MERVELFVHTVLCKPCRCYSRFQSLLDRCISRHRDPETSDLAEIEGMNPQQKQRVQDRIEAAVERDS